MAAPGADSSFRSRRHDPARRGSAPPPRARTTLGPSHWLGVALLVACLAAGSTAGAATPRTTLLPPKPSLSISGGGGEGEGGGGGSEGGENGSSSTPAAIATATSLPPPAAWVSRLQTKLARLGYFNGPTTGVYGPLTTGAVKRFQAANGLTADGRWGPASQAALTTRLAAHA